MTEALADERLALVDALIYADVFGCALTLDELRRYARAPIERDALRRRLREDHVLSEVVHEHEGLYYLSDRPALPGQRPERTRRAARLQRRARRVARVMRHVPFVRGLALTGSLAAGDARDGADVDLLVIVAPGRLATAFAMLAPVSRALGRRLFCPNYYLCADHLAMPAGSLYVARELVQCRPLAGDAVRLRAANPWVAAVFPNSGAGDDGSAVAGRGGLLQRALERPVRGRPGDAVERAAARLARARLDAHHRRFGEPVPAEVERSFAAGIALRFHGAHAGEATLERYAARRAEVAERLRASAEAGAGRRAAPV